MLTILVIAFGWLGIKLVGDPIRDHVFRVVFGLLMRVYELIATVLGGRR